MAKSVMPNDRMLTKQEVITYLNAESFAEVERNFNGRSRDEIIDDLDTVGLNNLDTLKLALAIYRLCNETP